MNATQIKLALQARYDNETDPAVRTVLVTEIEACRQAELREVVEAFVATAEADPDFVMVVTREQRSCCGLWLKGKAREDNCPRDGNLDCLAVAQDVLGNWSCVDMEGRVRQFFGDEVV